MKPLNLDDLQLIAEVTDFMPNCRQFTTEQIDGTWYALFESEDEILEVPLTLIDGCTLAPETQLELVAELRNDPGFVTTAR